MFSSVFPGPGRSGYLAIHNFRHANPAKASSQLRHMFSSQNPMKVFERANHRADSPLSKSVSIRVQGASRVRAISSTSTRFVVADSTGTSGKSSGSPHSSTSATSSTRVGAHRAGTERGATHAAAAPSDQSVATSEANYMDVEKKRTNLSTISSQYF